MYSTQRITVRKINHKLADVFFGQVGFDRQHWSRVTWNKNGLSVVKGAVMSSKDSDLVLQILLAK